MKKNITINLYGALFAIDDDAYELLEKYLNETKRYFMNRDGGDEIADDIEHRVAELLAEMKAEGKEVVTIDDIEAIIRRIGNPEEMDTETNENETSDKEFRSNNSYESSEIPPEPPYNQSCNSKTTGHRKLYRNPDDKMLGGLLSGFCYYFGGNDPLPWRLIFVLLAFASFQVMTVIYLVCWAVIPLARTPEDRLRMKGLEVNMQNINEEIMQSKAKKNASCKKQEQKSFLRELLNVLLLILIFCVKASVLILIIPLIIGTFICSMLWTWAVSGGLENLIRWDIVDADFSGILNFAPSLQWQMGLALLFAVIFWSCVLYIVVRAIFYTDNHTALRGRTRRILTWATIISALLSIIFTCTASILYDKAEDDYEIKSNTINGVYLKKSQRERLNRNSWEIKTYEHCNENGVLFSRVYSLSNEENHVKVMSFKQDKSHLPMRIHLTHAEYHPAGTYRMAAIASAKGPGAYVYVQSGHDSLKIATIPADDADDFGNMKYFYTTDSDDSTVLKADFADKEMLQELLPEHARYWSYIETPTFYHPGGLITIGTTNLGDIVHQPELNNPTYEYSIYDIKIMPVSQTNSKK